MENSTSLSKAAIIMALCFLPGCANMKQNDPKMQQDTYLDKLSEFQEDLTKGIENNNKIINQDRFPNNIRSALIPDLLNGKKSDSDAKVERRFDVTAENTPAKSFFLSLVKDTDQNVTVAPNLKGSISLNLKNVTIWEVFETVQNVYGYDYKVTDSGVEVYQPELTTKAFKINYLDIIRGGRSDMKVSSSGMDRLNSSSSSSSSDGSSSDSSSSDTSGSLTQSSRIVTNTNTHFWRELEISIKTLLADKKGRSVAVSPLSGLVVVTAMPSELRKIASFINQAEQNLNKQVILEAKIIEVELNDGFQAGINWSLLSGRLRASQLGGESIKGTAEVPDLITSRALPNPNAFSFIPPKDRGAVESLITGGSSFGGIFSLAMNYKNIAAFLDLLESQGKVSVLSSPSVSTTNNQKALIKVGEDEFFVTNITNTVTTSAGATTTTPSVELETFFSGIALDVTPQISEKDYVTLHIHPTISKVIDGTKTIPLGAVQQDFPLAKSSIRESDSIVRAKSGQLVIIGGLMQEKLSEVDGGVPVFKNIPGLGRLFKHKRKQMKKSELVILLRPVVVDNDKWNAQIENVQERLKRFNRG